MGRQVICVSHTAKENTMLRACLAPSRVTVIPNAIRAETFLPERNPACGPAPGWHWDVVHAGHKAMHCCARAAMHCFMPGPSHS